jgi:hypothetical protein
MAAAGLLLAAAPLAHAAPFTVTTTADSGTGSLRAAIVSANGTLGLDAITVATAGTVQLTSALPPITDDLTVTGPGADRFTVARAGAAPFRLLAVNQGVAVTLTGLRLTNGDAGADAAGGGAVLNAGQLTLSDVTVDGNTAQVRGGGISSLGGTLAVNRSTITRNSVRGVNQNLDFFGGGIYVESATVTITASALAGNVATTEPLRSGGGGAIAMRRGSTVSVVNSTISGNQARDRGAGIASFDANSRLNLTSVTLAGNGPVAGAPFNGGGAVYMQGPNGIVASANTLVGAAQGGLANCFATDGGSFVSRGHNLDAGTSCAFNQATDIVAAEPHLGPLAANGGPTLTRELLAGSPAVDAGTAAGQATDQRGLSRPQGATPDIGAFEVEVAAPPAAAPEPQVAPAAPAPPAPLAKPTRIDAPIRTFWNVNRRGTRVLQLQVRDVPAGGAVTLRCSGRGCPFTRKAVTVRRGSANALALFKKRRLRAGSVLEVRITAPGRISKVTRYTMRRNQLPQIRQLCLAPGATRPATTC